MATKVIDFKNASDLQLYEVITLNNNNLKVDISKFKINTSEGYAEFNYYRDMFITPLMTFATPQYSIECDWVIVLKVANETDDTNNTKIVLSKPYLEGYVDSKNYMRYYHRHYCNSDRVYHDTDNPNFVNNALIYCVSDGVASWVNLGAPITDLNVRQTVKFVCEGAALKLYVNGILRHTMGISSGFGLTKIMYAGVRGYWSDHYIMRIYRQTSEDANITNYVNIGGVWKPTLRYVNIGGVWRPYNSIHANIGGVWRK